MSDRAVAIIGYGARLPGAQNSDEVWDALSGERCSITDVPSERWSSLRFVSDVHSAPGKSYVARAGLLDDVFGFDNAYFGITPREAKQMDPQQRLVLETVATALDHAAIDTSAYDKASIGVFVGASSSDHSTTALEDVDLIDAGYMVGNTLSILSNRISFHWDLQGPSYTVDTACASGLFALDHARKAIARGEIDTAIVAGVNVLLSPIPFVGFSKAQMLSKTGLCRAFAKDADGYVRSEGAVAFILRAESQARARGDQIRSILVATGTNSDGRTPGISQPKSASQATLIKRVRDAAGIDPNDLAFIEAHGTGTAVGDPEEASAIGEAYGKHRTTALPIGSAKSNFGHLEPASGLVGLLKAQLALENEVIPASLHCEERNPNIQFDNLGLELVRKAKPFEKRKAPWLAAVNSFGFGGANAHAILKQVPKPAQNEKRSLPKALRLTAASEPALTAIATSWRERAAADGSGLADEISAANTRVTRHRHRLCLRAESARDLEGSIEAWLDGRPTSHASAGVAARDGARVGFVFPGNGGQWAGMGRHAWLTDPNFRKSFRETSSLFQSLGLKSLVDTLMSADLEDTLGHATVAQPLLLALQIALVDALAALGLKPQAVLGHSAGEFAAAYTAEVLNREDAVYSVFSRSNTLASIHGTGGMMAMATTAEAAADLIAQTGLDIDIAAENASNNVTVAGHSEALVALRKATRQSRIASKILPISYPYHSRMVDEFRDRLLSDMQNVIPSNATIDLYSGRDGCKVNGEDLTAEYWWKMTRNRVQFRNGISAMAQDGVDLFVEISGRSVLKGNIATIAAEAGADAVVIGTFEEQNHDRHTPTRTALEALANNAAMDETALLGGTRAFSGNLPNYPFQRTTFKLGSDKALNVFGRFQEHPLLGSRIAHDVNIWANDLSIGRHPWLADHKVGSDVVVPATAIVEMFRAAASEVSGDGTVTLKDLELLQPIMLTEQGEAEIRIVHEVSSDRLTLELRAGKKWQIVAFATLVPGAIAQPVLPKMSQGDVGEGLYSRLADHGLHYGPPFALVSKHTTEGMTTIAELQASALTDAFDWLDPCVLDAGLHAVIAFIPDTKVESAFVPSRFGRISAFPGDAIARSTIKLRSASENGLCIDVIYSDASGNVCLAFEELRLRPFRTAGALPHAFWDETLVPVSANPTSSAAESALAAVMSGSADPNVNVIRQAMAGRIAFDLISEKRETDGKFKALRQKAESALIGMKLAERDESGQVVPIGESPWPKIDTLIPLLASSCPGATDTLNGILRSETGDAPSNTGIGNVANRLFNSIANFEGRLLLAGGLDASLIGVLGANAADVVVTAVDKEAAKGLESLLDTNAVCEVSPLEDLKDGSKFDLVIGLNLLEAFSQTQRSQLSRLVAPGGSFMTLERSNDFFEAVTSPSEPNTVASQFADTLSQSGFKTSVHDAPDEPSVVLVMGHAANNDEKAAASAPTLHVVGEDGVLEKLVASKLETQKAGDKSPYIVVLPEASDPVEAALMQAKAFDGINSTAETVWLIQPNLEWARTLRAWRRCLVNETGRDLRVASFDPETGPSYLLEVLGNTHEVEVEFREGQVFAPRLKKQDVFPQPDGEAFRYVLKQPTGMQLHKLAWHLEERNAPTGQEVEIEVASTGLNFRDVLWAQGLLPPEMLEGGFVGPTLGMECAGVVINAGPEASLTPGTQVVAFASGAFASHVIAHEETAMVLPAGVNAETAASLPVPFLTAVYALEEMARLREGETVLIHGAAGGVGLAAVQVALKVGAKVVATAGNPAKRKLLETMGVDHVFDSRTLAFASEIETLTDGQGVDVVLNSLAGQALKQSLDCLAPFGRFVELGKRDFMANTPLGMRAMRKNISFFGVDVDQLLVHRPDVAKRIMASIIERIQDGSYNALPTTLVPAEAATSAFRRMQKSDHIGKIALRPKMPAEAYQTAPALGETWLVVGGTSGFGFETARWLASNGVKTLWIASRKAVLTPEQTELLAKEGVAVKLMALDVANQADVSAAMQKIADEGQKLDGLVHCAAIYGDGYFKDAQIDEISARLNVKLGGAVNLDRESRRFDLRHFWLFGSVATRFGNPGQSDYAAANAGLETIAVNRQREGLPGTTIAWGPIRDTGYLQRADGVLDLLEKQLGTVWTSSQALAMLEHHLSSGALPDTVTIAPIDWASLTSQLSVKDDPLFATLATPIGLARDADKIEVADLVAELGEVKARAKLIEIIRSEAASIIQAAPSDIDVSRPLLDLGLDSLMGLNLKMAVEERLGQTLPHLAIGDGLTLTDLAAEVIEIATGKSGVQEVPSQMIERHITDDDAKARLKTGLANGR